MTVICYLNYLNNMIEQDHDSIKSRIGPMQAFKDFDQVVIMIAGIDLLHRIARVSSHSGVCAFKPSASANWNASA